jgi:hypothetical protein
MRIFDDACASQIDSSGCYELDANLSRMTQTAAASGCPRSLAVTRLRSRRPSEPSGATCPGRVKQPDAAMNTESRSNADEK